MLQIVIVYDRMLYYLKKINIIITSILTTLIILYLIDNKINIYTTNNKTNKQTSSNTSIIPHNIVNTTAYSNKQLSSKEIKEFIKNGDINKGLLAIRKCITCHNLTEKKHYIGPHLVNIINRKQGSKKLNYNFSKALKNSKKRWSEEELFQFIYSPKTYLPNTKMMFYGIKNHKEIADIIAYIYSIQDNITS